MKHFHAGAEGAKGFFICNMRIYMGISLEVALFCSFYFALFAFLYLLHGIFEGSSCIFLTPPCILPASSASLIATLSIGFPARSPLGALSPGPRLSPPLNKSPDRGPQQIHKGPLSGRRTPPGSGHSSQADTYPMDGMVRLTEALAVVVSAIPVVSPHAHQIFFRIKEN